MARGKRNSGPTDVARPFRVKWDPSTLRWCVIQCARWRFVTALCIQVMVLAEHGELVGVGVVRSLKRGEIVVTA